MNNEYLNLAVINHHLFKWKMTTNSVFFNSNFITIRLAYLSIMFCFQNKSEASH